MSGHTQNKHEGSAHRESSRANQELTLCCAGLCCACVRASVCLLQVIDVAGGDKIPRKGGPGITQADLLVINKTDLAEAVGADLDLMGVQAAQMRGDGPVLFAQVKHMVGVDAIAQQFLDVWKNTKAGQKYKARKEAAAAAGGQAAASSAAASDDVPPPLESALPQNAAK